MKCRVVVTACLIALTAVTAAHAAGRNDEIEAHALESSRAASRAIFAVLREERAIAETSPLRTLLQRMHELQQDLRRELVVSVSRASLAPAGTQPQASASSYTQSRVRAARVQEQRRRIYARLGRVERSCDDLALAIDRIPSRRERAVARAALRKARALDGEIRRALRQAPTEERRRLRELSGRLAPATDPIARRSTPPLDRDPGFRTGQAGRQGQQRRCALPIRQAGPGPGTETTQLTITNCSIGKEKRQIAKV